MSPNPSLDQLAQQLTHSGQYRVLQRVPPVEKWDFTVPSGEVVRGCIVDCETTGLADDDEIIELAVLPFDYDRETARLVAVYPEQAVDALREPSKPLPEEATKVHGLTPADVAGKSIDLVKVASAVEGAAIVIAHHAAFDRPMTERLWAGFERFAWACSCEEVPWYENGFGSRGLEFLLYKAGYFHDGHRALTDCMSLLFLLSLDLPGTGQPALHALLESARKPQYSVRVQGSLFDERELLKARGYRWEKLSRTWWTTVSDEAAERAWLKSSLTWVDQFRVETSKVPANMRYSRRAPGGNS